jgi:Putative beta-lactamase-inhibitor-like, PepSY-like
MKSLMQAAFAALLVLVVACSKTATEDVVNTNPVDATQIVVDELLTGVAGGGGSTAASGGDTTRHGFGHRGGGRHNHPSGRRGDSIGFSQLPTAAQTYINTNAGGKDSVKSVFKVTLPDSTVGYSVRMKNGKHYHFDAQGNLLNSSTRGHVFTRIVFADLPAAAKTYLLANSDTTKITHIIKVTLQAGGTAYGVRLSDNSHFWFDASGALLARRPR